MTLELIPENDARLHASCEVWDFKTDGSPKDLTDSMMELMKTAKGVGLSANQVGVMKRVFVMGVPGDYRVLVNPQLVSLSDKMLTEQEGCLSFPDLWMKITRPAGCIMKYQDVDGEEHERPMTGLEARIALHEYHHLQGKTFDQVAGKVTLSQAKERRAKFQKKRSRIADRLKASFLPK